MDAFVVLTVAAILLGAAGVLLFFWTLKSGQYEDLDGAAHRILIDDEDDDSSARGGLSRDDRAVGVPRRVPDQRKDDDQADE